MSHRTDAQYVAGLGWPDRVRAILDLYRQIDVLTVENDVLHHQLDDKIRDNHVGHSLIM